LLKKTSEGQQATDTSVAPGDGKSFKAEVTISGGLADGTYIFDLSITVAGSGLNPNLDSLLSQNDKNAIWTDNGDGTATLKKSVRLNRAC
jgi:hypothetical protein